MTKLNEFFPEQPAWVEKTQRLDQLINFASAAIDVQKSQNSGNETFRSPAFGIDNLAYLWSRQYTQNRAQMINDLFAIASTVAEIRAPVIHIRNEVFRRGIEWHAKFSRKCTKCNQIYQDEVEKCTACGSTELAVPDPKQKERLAPFIDNCNVFGNSLVEISKQLEWDVNVADEMYLYVAKEFIEDGEDVRSKPLEIRRLNPAYIEMDLNSKGLPKANHFTCLIHRDKVKKAEATTADVEIEIKCPECKRPMVPIMWIFYYRGAKKYLLESEVCRASKFEINELGGFSPILTIFEKALTLIGMDKVAFKYFFERKLPASLLMIFTDDTEGLRREREGILQQLAKSPDYVPMMAVSAKQGSRGRAELIRLFHTFAEMDYMPIKNEIRERIASLWGVTPIWQTAVESVGGMSSQTAQLVVTSRVVESDQSIFNDKMFPFITNAFGISDWELKLRVPEEKAESTRIQFGQQRIAAANMLHMMGFSVKLKPGVKSIDDVDFIVSGEAMNMQQQMGGMSGAPGGAPNSGAGGQPSTEEGGQGPSEAGDRSGDNISDKFPGFNVGKSFMIKAWIPQIIEKGLYLKSITDIKISPDGANVQMLFMSTDDHLYEALFNQKGDLLGINRTTPAKPGMHSHEGYPSVHPSSLPHDTLTQRGKREGLNLSNDAREAREDADNDDKTSGT
jgi:hypothetical protein